MVRVCLAALFGDRKTISLSSTTLAGKAPSFAETDLDRANYEATIADLMTGQHSDPLRVVIFNPETKDASHASRLGLEGRSAVSA